MSFFGYRVSDAAARQNQETQQSEMERLRGRQLASLVRAGGRAKNHQQTTFEVAVAETPRGPLTLIITLPTDFPVEGPQIQASLPVQHSWLDANGNVHAHNELNQWTAHSDLGRIVSEIAVELRRLTTSSVSQSASPVRQPTITPQSYASAYPYQVTTHQPPPKQKPQQQEHARPDSSQTALKRSQLPEIPIVFPELDSLSVAEMENFASDPHALKKFVKKMETVQEFMRLRQEVLNGNIAIAEKTLSHESTLTELQEEVGELRDVLRESQQALAEKQIRQQRVVERHRPDVLLHQLASSTRELDTTSDDLAHEFTHGDIDFSEFVSKYMPQRTLYHERTLKLNKVTQQ